MNNRTAEFLISVGDREVAWHERCDTLSIRIRCGGVVKGAVIMAYPAMFRKRYTYCM